MKYSKISIFDFICKNSEVENEDAIAIRENNDFMLFAMSDGAGGIGIYCKEWADYIVKNQPDYPIDSNKDSKLWFQEMSKSFYEYMKPRVNYDNIFIGERFDCEGSYATLLYLWVCKTEKTFYLSGVGDTTLFYFKTNKDDLSISLIEPISKQLSLEDNPELLNWQKSLDYSLESKGVIYENGDTIIIASDSLSRRIIYQLLLLNQNLAEQCLNKNINKTYNRDFLEYLKLNQEIFKTSDFIDYLRKLINKDIDSFRKELVKWIERNELENDDYSFIIIDL